MTVQERIAEAFSRKAAALQRRPSSAKNTGTTTVRLLDGLACEVRERNWRFVADQPKALGGEGEGPDPGFFGRAALGVCLAQGYAYWFAKLNVPVRTVEVCIESDIDTRGLFGVAKDVPPGYEQIRSIVSIDSDAEKSLIMEALDKADQLSPWLYNFSTGLQVTREVTIR